MNEIKQRITGCPGSGHLPNGFTPTGRHGYCPGCGAIYSLRNDGKIRAHRTSAVIR